MKSGKKKPAQFCFRAAKLTALLMALLVSLSVFSVSAFAADVAEQTVEQPVMAETPVAEAPAESPEAPAESPEAPAESPEAPAESPEAPAESPEASAESPEAPTESPEAPAEEPEAPAEEPEAPTESPEAPTEEPEPPTEEQEAPTEEQKTPAEEQEAPAEEPEAPAEEPEAPAEEQKAPAEKPEAPAEEPEAPAEEPGAPAEKQEALTEGGEAPAAPAESGKTSAGTGVPAEAAPTVQEAPTGVAMAAAPAMLAYTAPLGEMPAGDKIETIVEVEMTTASASETVTAATAELSLKSSSGSSGNLQEAIDEAILTAQAKGEKNVYVVLKSGTTYSGSVKPLSDEGKKFSSYTFKTNGEESATINSEIKINSVFVEIINILFGNDCIISVENDGELTVGNKNQQNQRFEGELKVIAGKGNTCGDVTVYAGNGASVISNVISGTDSTVTVTNSAGDRIVFSGNTDVAITSGKAQDTAESCNVVISSKAGANITAVNAWDANVVVNTPVVTFSARNDGMVNQLRSLKVIAASENNELFNLSNELGLTEILKTLGVDDPCKIATPVETAQVNIDAGITAREDITVYSFTTQTKNFIKSLINLEMNVKIGNAEINVAPNVALNAGSDITLKATTRSNAGFDDNGKEKTGDLPVAFNIFVENASVKLGDGSSLTAGGDITADALSTIAANASCNFDKLFVGVAFNVIINDALVDAYNTTLTSANGNVNLISKAETKAIAEAKRGKGNGDLDGMYFATNVVLQSSEAKVGSGTVISAEKGDVNISSTSDVDATDDAIASVGTQSANPASAPSTPSLKDSLKKFGFEILGKVKDTGLKAIKDKVGNSSVIKGLDDLFTRNSTKINKAQGYFKTDGYVVEINAASQEKGTVKTSTVSNEKGKMLTISVDSKYKVQQVLIRYLPANSSNYEFLEAAKSETGNYEIDLMAAIKGTEKVVTLEEFRIFVLYSDKPNDVPSEEDGEEDDDSLNIADLFDSAMESASDDSDADFDCAGNIGLAYITKFADKPDSTIGRVVPDAMSAAVSQNMSLISAITGVAPGKNVRFNPNVSDGKYQIKTMAATYKNANGEEKTVAIEKNNAGHYVFAVPTDIKENSTLTITTEFEERAETEKSKNTPSENQKTGSLSVGVVVNNNNAIVDPGESGSVTAGGKVNVSAEATSNISGKADGTAVTKAEIEKGKTVKQAATGADLKVETVKVKEGEKETSVKLYIYGQSVDKSVTAVLDKTTYTITLAPNADTGFTMPDYVMIYILGEDNREHAIKVNKGEDGKFTVNTKNIDFKNDILTNEEQTGNTNYTIRSTKFIAQYGTHTYKVSVDKAENGSVAVDRSSVRGNDTITVTPTAKEGYIAEKVILKYKVKNGTGDDAKEEEKTIDFKLEEGKYTLKLGVDSELAKWIIDSTTNNAMTVSASFKKAQEEKREVVVDGSLVHVDVDNKTPTYGGTVTVKPAEGANILLDATKFYVQYTDNQGTAQKLKLGEDFTFTIPAKDKLSADTKFTVNSDGEYSKELKVEIEVNSGIENGKVTVNDKRTKTGAGDTIFVTVKPDDGYLLKGETLIAEYQGATTTVRLGQPIKVSDNVYKFKISDAVGNTSGKITITAQFKIDDTVSYSVGGAVAVDVGVHRNNALVKSGSISAIGGVTVSAVTNGKAVTEALAGYSKGKTGIAGSIAVEVVSFKTNAIIGRGVSLGAGNSEEHELSVNAASNISSFKTNADTSKIKDTAEKAGVGTGIAVAVNGVETVASINDGVVYTYSEALKNATVSANNKLTSDEVNAKAGAKSATLAVSPVVGLNIITSDAKAYIGKFINSNTAAVTPLYAKAVTVKAANSAVHKMAVDTSASGSTAVMAGSFGINIIDDNAKAILNSSVLGSSANVTVDAQSVSTLDANVKASSAGAKEGKKEKDDSKGSADKKADSIINSGEKIAAKADMGSPTDDKTKNRQQAQTAEGTIAGAAAFVLNIQSNESTARIEDGVALGGSSTTEKLSKVSVASRAMASASITADGSATSKNTAGGNATGIGVAVAINIVSTKNNAYLGKGRLNAGEVSVTALMSKEKVDDEEKEQTSTFKTSSVSGASSGGVGVAGSVALAVLNNTTEACISKAADDSYNAASTTLMAKDNRIAETTASASATEDGKPDKNDTKKDKNKAADADTKPDADGKTKSVGVGASFAMVYGDNTVTAEFIAPASANAGVFVCEAVSDHSEESTAVAGTDPTPIAFDPASAKNFEGKSTNVAVDAAVAVNAVQSTINAKLTGNGSQMFNASRVRLNALEKGHSKTDSSGYAMGVNTAVGGSVAVNLNKSNVCASNGCFLKITGDDAAGDDEEDHQRSVEITASSAVTEENISYATAAGSDVLRYAEKYKELLNECGEYTTKLDEYKQKITDEAKRIEAQAEFLSQVIKGFLDGTYFNAIQEKYDKAVSADGFALNSGNKLADKIISMIPVSKELKDKAAVGSKVLSLSANLLKLLNVSTPSTDKMDQATDQATANANAGINGTEASGTNEEGTKQETNIDNNAKAQKPAESMQLAAAVGVSVSRHAVIAENKGEVETKIGSIEITADNTVDAIAKSVGAAFSTNKGTGSIALAIAVKVDSNIAKAVSANSITVGSGKDVIISANLKENTNDFSKSESGIKTDFTSEIGTEAIAGAVAGEAKVAVSGAAAVFVSSSEILAELAGNAGALNDTRAGNVTVSAIEQARQTMRVASVSVSQASNLTMGISAGILVTKNVTQAKVGSGSIIKAKNIKVEAERKSVLIGNESGLTVETTEDIPNFGNDDTSESDGDGSGDGNKKGTTGVTVKGIPENNPILVIDTKKSTKDGKQTETLSVQLDQDKTTKLLENALNSFSGVDYYLAVDSGAVAVNTANSSSSGIGSIAGSVAVAIINNTVSAIIEEGAVLDSEKDIAVEAVSGEQSRVIAGAISVNTASGSKLSTGAVIAFLYENNAINALVNDVALLTAGGELTVIGKNAGRSEVYTVTAAASSGSTATVAATIDVILSEAAVSVKLGNPGTNKAHTAQAAKVIAENSKALRNFTVSLAASAKGTAQVGGAVAVILEDSSATVTAESTRLFVTGMPVEYNDVDGLKVPYAQDSIVILADNTHDMFVIVASASVAGGSKVNVAGVVSIILDESDAIVTAAGSTFKSNTEKPDVRIAGNITIAARNESDLLNANVQVTAGGSGAAAVGAAVTVNILKRVVKNTISTAAKPTVITLNNGNVNLTADAADKVIIIAAGANGSAANVSVQGTIVVLVEQNTAEVTAQKLSLSAINYGTVISCGETTVRAKFTGELYGVAGGINFTSGSTAAGATVVVAVTNNTTTVDLTDSVITSAVKADIIASADTKSLFISIGAAVANSAAVEGSVVTVVASDHITIHLGTTSVESGNVNINALGKSSETYISGAIAASQSVSVGPSVLVFVKEREVRIDSTAGGKIGGVNGCNVTALAQAEDDIFTLVIAAAASGSMSVSAGVCTEVINNTVLCDIDADVNAGSYIITIGAKSDRHIANYIFGGGFGASGAVVPVATVIYLTDNVTCDVSGNLKGYTVNITADTLFELKEFAAGAALGGTAGISGTFAVVVNNSNTHAIFTGSHAGKAKAGDSDATCLNVLANDNYKFNSLMANLAGSGTAAVGVTAAITVVRNSVLASIGNDSTKKSINADQINVRANSTREIINRIGCLAAAGTAGVSVNLAVIVAGSKLPQDAYDMLTKRTENGKTTTTFDSSKLLTAIRSSNPYAANNGCLDNVTLSSDIQGNGKKDSATKATSVDGSTFVSSLADEKTQDYTASESNATEAATLRGENNTVDPSTDTSVNANTQAAKNVIYTYDVTDIPAVQAIVKNVVINCKELTISAEDIQIAEIDSVNGAVSGTAAAAVGVSVLVLHSNVIAELASTAEVTCRNLAIKASSGSGAEDVKVIGGVVSVAGSAGVGVAVAVVHLDDFVKASLAGKVTAAPIDGSGINNTVNVIAESNYKNVLAETVAIGAGGVGVSASVAVVSLNGDVISSISGQILSARNSGSVVNGFAAVNDLVFFNNSVTARAASLGAGGVGAAIGVAVASETLRVISAIEEGAVVELDSTNNLVKPSLRVLVAGSYNEIQNQTSQGVAQALAQIASVSGGAVAAGFAVAVAYVEPMIRAYIAGTVKNDLGRLDATVGNDIYTKADTGLFSASVGAASFGANVLISYNKSNASSTVTGSVTADTLTVMSLLSANAVSNMLGIQAGGVAIGVSTVIAILDAENTVSVGTGAAVTANTLNVLAGATAPGNYQAGADFFADAQLYSGSVSKFAVQLNAAVAVNKALNKASLNTNGNVLAGTVNVYAYGNPTASSKTNKLSLALGQASGSAAASSLNFRQIVEINCNELYGRDGHSLSDVNGASYLYPGEAKDPEGKQFTRDYNQASSSVDVFDISGIAIKGNVSYSKNKTLSQIIANIGSKIGNVRLDNNGSANSLANIAEVGGNVLGVGANVVLSYVQAQFITKLNMKNDVEGNVDLTTDYTSNADASVKAASGSLAGLNANVIVAKSTTMADTYFNGNSHAVKADSVSVRTLGDSATQAKVLKPAKVSVAAVEIAANVIESILKTEQMARIENVKFAGNPTILVNSVLNAGSNSKENSALAKFEGAPDAVSVKLGDLKVNVVLAKNYAENLASLSNVTSADRISSSTVSAENASNACADAGTSKDGDGFDAALVGVGVVVSTAHNEGKNTAEVDNYNAATNTLNVTANMKDASAESYGGTASQGVAAVADIKVNVSDAVNSAENTARIVNSQAAIDNVALKATAENVHAKARIGSAKLTVSGLKVATNNVTATNNYSGNAVIENSTLNGSSLDIQSLENQHYFEEDKYTDVTSAEVGSAGTTDGKSISLISGEVNTAKAENTSVVAADVTGSVLTGYNVTMFADGRSDVSSNIANSAKIGLLDVTVVKTEANANGTVRAEFDPSATKSNIASLDVKAYGSATANAVSGVAGSINASVASVDSNSAKADIQMLVKAAVSGGNLNVAKDASVSSIASAVAKAESQTPAFSISGLRIGVNEATATSNIKVETDVLPDEYTVGGQLNTLAKIPTETELKYVLDNHPVYFEKASTEAIVTPSAGGKDKTASVALVGGSNHTAEAFSEHEVTVNIGGNGTASSANSGKITAGSLNAEAVGNANTDAKALDVDASYGLITAGGKVAHAEEKDVAAVNIKTVSINTKGAVDIKAHNDSAEVNAVGTTPGGFSAVDAAKSEMQATVNNSAKIAVSDNAIIEGGSISFKAANSGSAETALSANGSKSSLGRVNDASASVDETYNTEILFGNGSKTLAQNNLDLVTNTYSKSYSNVHQATGGAAFDAEDLYGSSKVSSTNHIQTGSNATVSAKNSDVNVDMTNRGDIRSASDYNSGFSLIGTNQVRSYNNYSANNNFEMLDGSSVAADSGNVVIDQSNSDVTLDASSTSISRSGIGVGDAGGSNIVNSSNTFQYADVSAKKGIIVNQYGGAKKAEAYGTVYESGLAGTCEANGINDFTINNLVNALNNGDLKAEGIMIVQGADQLGLNSGAKGVAEGAIFAINGSSNNNVKIYNNLAGGSKEIGQGAKRVFVSNIDAAGNIASEMKASSTFVKFGEISSTNSLRVESKYGNNYSVVLELEGYDTDPNQGGFHFYQNKFNPNKITGAKNTYITYIPDGLKRYPPSTPNNPSNNNTNYQKQTSSNSFVEMFLQQLIDSRNAVRGLGNGLKFYLDEDGSLVIENSAFFAADLEQMDANWLYNFLTAGNIRFMGNFHSISELDLGTTLTAIINSSVPAYEEDDNYVSIVFSVDNNGENHVFKIVFDRASGKVSAYCVDDGKMIPVSIVIIEMNGVLNVIAYHEEENIREAFIYIPDLVDGELPIIKVKVNDSMLFDLFQK